MLLLAGGWSLAGCRWVARRFGRRGVLALAILALVVSGSVGYAYWLDEPNRRLVHQIEQINGCIAATRGGIFTGTVDNVVISSKASDEDVRCFTELDGLDGLRRLLIIEARISDATAKRLGRFSRLKYLTLYKTGVTEEAIEQLRIDLPECDIKDQ